MKQGEEEGWKEEKEDPNLLVSVMICIARTKT